jgi:hypothetical protein
MGNLRNSCCSKEPRHKREELDGIRKAVKKEVRNEQKTAWADFRASFDSELEEVIQLIAEGAGL